MRAIIIEDVRRRLEQLPDPGAGWLWCAECRRFFQYKSVLDGVFPHDRCPFPDCYGCGLGFNLLAWDDMREPADPLWPRRADELEHGMRSPDMEPFYAAQLMSRITDVVTRFASSREKQDELGDDPIRYLGGFLKMMSDLCSDLTDMDEYVGFDGPMTRELLDQMPVWCRVSDPAEAPRMTAELRAFFRFAARTDAVQHAAAWQTLLAVNDIDDLLIFTMKNDRRLRPARPKRGPARARKRRNKKKRQRTR